DRLFAAPKWRGPRSVANFSHANCCGDQFRARPRNLDLSVLRISRRHHFEFDAVRVAGDFAENLWIYSTGGTKPPEDFSERYRVYAGNLRLVHWTCAASDFAQRRRTRRDLGWISVH